jgi:hydroxymethylpyrimidine/phosphomethylpyrimidine kinase
MREAARRIFGVSGIPCLVKGGHLKRGVADILYDGVRTAIYEHSKLHREVHGTGCFLSSSILAFLASGRSLENACALATDFAHRALREAEKPGRGRRIFSFRNGSGTATD